MGESGFHIYHSSEGGDVMSEQIYLLSFPGVSEAEANQYAEELREI